MAFYHEDGLVPAFKQARTFAGPDGRIATMPDIIAACLATKPGMNPWENWFTTLSAEYVGLSRTGHPIVIVAHGIGPMSTLDGIQAAYSYEFNDKSRNNRGGRISNEQFWKLESGAYGDVAVIDLVATWNRRLYQFSNHPVTAVEVAEEPLWQARLGAQWEAYVAYHTKFAHDFHREHHAEYAHPCIIAMNDASNCGYSDREFFDYRMSTTPDMALAHLLSIGRLMKSHHDYYEHDYQLRERRVSLARDVGCHEWSDGVRFLAIKPGGQLNEIHPSVDVERAIRKYWERLMVQVDQPPFPGAFYALMKINEDTLFTQYPKKGARLDTGAPEFRVVSAKRIHTGPRTFRTTIGGYHGFFKYDIQEVRSVAPQNANAYLLPGDVKIVWEDGNPKIHETPIEFYRVEIDTTRRLMRASDLRNNFDLMMQIAELER